MRSGSRRRGDERPDAGAAAPPGRPGPRRPAPAAGQVGVPGQGENRPSSLDARTNKSTPTNPCLKYRSDDIGRGFLYAPAIQTEQSAPPPVNDGPRKTRFLSVRAVRQIKGAAIKAEQLGYPMRTMLTFTVRKEERAAFEVGDFILGREMRRVINALNQWFKRRGHPLLLYIWVAENVRNENPHVHMLTNHTVPKSMFEDFARHVEALWGHGWVHIERVKNPSQAGRYLMKALKYTLKGARQDERLWGENDDHEGQGVVIGNRYGIARVIVPQYKTIELHDCTEAEIELKRLCSLLGDDGIEEYAPGIWKTKWGLAFEAGNDSERMREVIDQLAQAEG